MTRSIICTPIMVFSKLRAAQNGIVVPPVVPASEIAAFAAELGALTPVTGGTLNHGFLLRRGATRRFAKTHAIPNGSAALEREAALLGDLYGERLGVEIYRVGARVWLIMDELEALSRELSISEIVSLLAAVQHRLWASGPAPVFQQDNGFSELLEEAGAALDQLAAQGRIADEANAAAAASIKLLRQRSFPPFACHGDLSPRNIMADRRGLIVIDWEDAFWGIEGYDYLYWLTFMTQRKLYSPTMFGRTPWGKDVEIAVMILVIVLKSWVAVLTGAHVHNQLSVNQRILEIAAFSAGCKGEGGGDRFARRFGSHPSARSVGSR